MKKSPVAPPTAAKAAALAQKKSAAALSRARQAEESLAREQAVKLQLEKQSQVLQHRLRGLQAQLHFINTKRM